MSNRRPSAAVLLALLAMTFRLVADSTPQSLPFTQSWTNVGLITADDSWSGVPGIVGYRGDDLTAVTGTDPQTIVADGTAVVDVIANQTNTAITNGGVAEFEIANPVVALQGSGTADAPFLLITVTTLARQSIVVSYNVRDIDATTDNAVQQVALQYRVGTSGNFTNLPSGYVADATTGPSLATLVTPVSVTLPSDASDKPVVQIRIMTTNAASNDEWVGIDDLSVTGTVIANGLSINDATVTEGDSGTTNATFTVSLSQPAPAGGAHFDLATQDLTATAGTDYGPLVLPGQTIPEGQQTAVFSVPVIGELNAEGDETFRVNVTNVSGTDVQLVDGQGIGTILNDDVMAIHDIQGPGNASPVVGTTVLTRGIVTARKSNGFFLQSPGADGDPGTSEGVFVFTSAAPPVEATVGNDLTVKGTVSEFVPSADPLQPPTTELVGPTGYVVNQTGMALPSPIEITPADTDPAGDIEQLEKLEGMRVRAASLTVVAPTQGTTNEPNATGTTNGVFYGVLTGIARPFREPGIQANNPPPSGSGVTIPPVPRFDGNPERLRVDSDGQPGAAAIDVATGALVTDVVGVLDYGFRTYTILPDPGTPPGVSGGMTPTAVPEPTSQELTIGSYNLERFFDTTNDAGISDPVLTPTAFANRLKKASLAIRDYLRAPDVLGVVEMENLTTLQALASQISADALAAGQPDPLYASYLVEGNDSGGIDVGFLVKTAPVVGATPRVTVNAVVQEGLTDTYVDPNTGNPALLNDRPPLRLDAVINHANGATFPVTVIVNHLRSLNDIDNEAPSGSGTEGTRVRAKRRAQAEFLANLVQARQTGNPNERIVLVGDFNAFEVNDGLVDVMGTILGTPTPAGQVAAASADLVNPDLVNLGTLAPAAEQYSYSFDGNAQTIDHVLVNQAMWMATASRRIAHARIDADFPESARSSASTPVRLSDHDPVVAGFTIATFPVTLTTFTAE